MSHAAQSNLIGPGNNSIQSIHPGKCTAVGNVTSSSSVPAGPFAETTTVLRLYAAAAMHYVMDSVAAAATADHTPLPAGLVEYVNVCRGEKISFIADSTTGKVWVTEGN